MQSIQNTYNLLCHEIEKSFADESTENQNRSLVQLTLQIAKRIFEQKPSDSHYESQRAALQNQYIRWKIFSHLHYRDLLRLQTVTQLWRSFALQFQLLVPSIDLSKHGKYVDDQYLGNIITTFPNLIQIDLSYCQHVTCAGLELLQKLPHLKSLIVQCCSNIKSFAWLQPLKELEYADLYGTNSRNGTSSEEFESFSALNQLRFLRLGYLTRIKHLQPLSNFLYLQHLEITYFYDLSSIEHIAALTQLRTLNLAYCEKLRNITSLMHLTNLTSLNLSVDGPTDRNGMPEDFPWRFELHPLQNLPLLTSLNLKGNRWCEDQDLRCMASLTNLKSLNLSQLEAVENWDFLAGLRSFIKLNLNSCHGFSDFTVLQNQIVLQKLNVSWTGIKTFAGIENLSNLTSLGRVINYASQITAAHI